MKGYINKSTLKAEIERIEYETNYEPFTEEVLGKRKVCKDIKDFLDISEVKDIEESSKDFERKEEIRKRAEYIANGIMIAVQANKYNTNVYDYEKECYKHSHLMDAAIEGAKWADEHPREDLVDINKVYDFMEHKLLDYVGKSWKEVFKALDKSIKEK